MSSLKWIIILILSLTLAAPAQAQFANKSDLLPLPPPSHKKIVTVKLPKKPGGQFMESEPRDLPEIQFFDEAGKSHTLDDFYGKVILVNFWATWCTPCVREMPDISTLQKEFKHKNFKVVAISEDFKGAEEVRAFYKESDISNLGIYIDKKNNFFKELQIVGLPTSIIINSHGKEIARSTGYIKWEDPDLKAYFESLTDGKDYPAEIITLQPPPTPPVAEKEKEKENKKQDAAPKQPQTPVKPVAPKAPTAPAAPKAPSESKSLELPPEAVTVVPQSSLVVNPDAVQKIPDDSPQGNARRPVYQPIDSYRP